MPIFLLHLSLVDPTPHSYFFSLREFTSIRLQYRPQLTASDSFLYVNGGFILVYYVEKKIFLIRDFVANVGDVCYGKLPLSLLYRTTAVQV